MRSTFKLYDRVLWVAAAARSMLGVLRLYLGLMKGQQGLHISVVLRCASRQAHEWSQPIYVSVDVDPSLDQIEAYNVEKTMLAHKAPTWTIAAVRGSMWAKKGGRRLQRSLAMLRFGKVARQGASGRYRYPM